MENQNRDDFPFIAEAIAIDLSNSLISAETGIRAFSDQGFVRRLWGGLNGGNQELLAQMLGDTVTAQRAAARYIDQILQSHVYSQKCLAKISRNLIRVIEEAEILKNDMEKLSEDFVERLQSLNKDLRAEIGRVEMMVRRKDLLERLISRYCQGMLLKGFAPVLRKALFIAQVDNIYGEQPENIRLERREWALYSIANGQPEESPDYLRSLLLQTVAGTTEDVLPMAIYITRSNASAVVKTLHLLLSRKYVQLPVDESNIEETLKTTAVATRDRFLQRGTIFTPQQLSLHIAEELTHE